jgi:UDP-N-acetylglucosamine--N-acetylmuramyl-(pentapeptide) pyrophosphoryl-undecaprenol N-acetylglucosamine transferase
MTRRVVVAGGGTGGHVFPGLAVAAELQSLGIEVHWLGARRGLEAELVPERGLPITLVELEGIQARSPAAAARAVTLLPRAVLTAVRTLLELEPLAVVGVGGYASVAGLAAAGLLGLPTILQEQNSIPGMTNRFLAPWADLICCGFADAVPCFPSLPAEWTGNPVRQHFFDIGAVEPHDPPRLLVLGGSQGSLFLNRILPRAVAVLGNQGVRFEIQHQTGGRWAEVVKTSYADLEIEADVSAFLAEPWRALGEADLVVARSGALTVSELAAAGRGALLVPFAEAAGNHQEFNARSLERAGGAVVLTEAEVNPVRLVEVLGGILGDEGKMKRMGAAAKTMALPDAARRIAQRVLAIGGGQ